MSRPNLSVANVPVCVLTFWIIGLVSGCGVNQIEDNGLCCDMCQPGTHLTEFCSRGQKTICNQCPQGFFSDRYHSLDRCDECQSCQQAYVEKCTVTTNAKCACGPGFLCSNSKCSRCVENKCVKGYTPKKKVISPNEWLEEYSYECEPFCPENTFFDAGSCKPRTQCRELGLTERFPGNETHNSVCDKPETWRRDQDFNHIFLGLGCIFLSITFLLFLSYQAVKKLRKHRANKVQRVVVAAHADDSQLSKEESGLLFIIQNESEDSKSVY